MSGFFGVFSPGGNIDQAAFTQLQHAIHREGYDELSTHVDDYIAMGHLMPRVTKESVYDKQPLNSSCGRYLLVGHFRLDYRDELGDKLGITQKELELTPDSLLVMLSYQKWEDQCVHHIEGDWAFAVFDYHLEKLFLFRDSCGYSLIFYSIINSQLYFTTIPTIFYEIQDDGFDIDFEQLYKLSLARGKIDGGKSLISNVFVLESSYVLDISNRLVTRKTQYVNFINKKFRYKSLDDYLFELKSRLSKAILERIKFDKIGVFQSAGIDSSALTFFISNELVYRHSTFKTFTAFPKYLSSYSLEKQVKIREDDKVRKIVSNYSNCIPFYLNFQSENFSSLLDQVKNSNIVNPIVSANTHWIDGIFKCAKKEGVQILFAGKMGNYTFSWNAPFIGGSYFYSFRWIYFYKYCKIVSKRRAKSFFKIALKEIYLPFVLKFNAIYKRIRNEKFGNIFVTSVFNFGNLKYLRNKLFFDSKKFHPEFTGFQFPKKLRKNIYFSNVDQLGQRSYLDSQSNSLLVTDPYSDKRFVEFSFGIPEFLFNYDGEEKFIAKRILSKLYEEKDSFYVSGAPQAYDIGVRLKLDFNLNFFLNQFNSKSDFREMFNEARILEVYSSLKEFDTNASDIIKSQEILRALSIISFYYKTNKLKD